MARGTTTATVALRGLVMAGAAAGGMALLAPAAGAHVTPDKDEVPAGGFTSVTLTVPHGCEESPTRELVVEVPEGINSVTPQVHPGWDIEVGTEQLAEPIDDGEGGEITERSSQVTFTAQAGNELDPHFRDEFTIGFQAPDAPGEYLFFKTVQTCVEGETAWIEEYTGEGEEPEHPAPALLVTEAEGDGHGGGSASDSDDAATAEDGEATAASAASASSSAPDADDGDDATGLAVAGLVVGVLGLGTGGFALVRTRRT